MQFVSLQEAFQSIFQARGKDGLLNASFTISTLRDMTAEKTWKPVSFLYRYALENISELIQALDSGESGKPSIAVQVIAQKTGEDLLDRFFSEETVTGFLEAIMKVWGVSYAGLRIRLGGVRKVSVNELSDVCRQFFGDTDISSWRRNQELVSDFRKLSKGKDLENERFLFEILLDASEGSLREYMENLVNRQDESQKFFEVKGRAGKAGLEEACVEEFLNGMKWALYPKPKRNTQMAGNGGKSAVSGRNAGAGNSAAGGRNAGSGNSVVSGRNAGGGNGAAGGRSVAAGNGTASGRNTGNGVAGSGNSATAERGAATGKNASASGNTGTTGNKYGTSGKNTAQSKSAAPARKKKKSPLKTLLKTLLGIIVIVYIIGKLPIPWQMISLPSQSKEDTASSDSAVAKNTDSSAVTDASDNNMIDGADTDTGTAENLSDNSGEVRDLTPDYSVKTSFNSNVATGIQDTDLAINSAETPDYTLVADLDGYNSFCGKNYSFLYPVNLYKNVNLEVTHSVVNGFTTTFSSDDGSFLSYGYSWNDRKPNAEDGNLIVQTLTEDMTDIQVIVNSFDESNGALRYYAKGTDAGNPGLTVVKAINWGQYKDGCVYQMVIKYPNPIDDSDRSYKEYYARYLYDTCNFTDSQEKPVTYEEYQKENGNM